MEMKNENEIKNENEKRKMKRRTDMGKKEFLEDIYEAYVYAYPAVIEELTRRSYLNSKRGGEERLKTNTLYHTAALADATFKNVVAPNIDTVYSQAWLDLKDGALVLHKPQLDRYVSIAILDAYTNCEHIVGTGGDGAEETDYLITGPDYKGEIPAQYKEIALPTNRNWLIIRTIIYGREDIEEVKRIQREITLSPFQNTTQEVLYPQYQEALEYKPIEKISSLSLKEFFGIFNELLKENVDAYAPENLKTWEKYGIKAGGIYEEKEEALEKELEEEIKKRFAHETAGGLKGDEKFPGWIYLDEAIGVYKDNYFLRANVARNGLGANPVTMCVYPSAYTDSNGNELDGKKKYKIHFEKGQLPPVEKDGFWSITLYDSKERYLVENEIGRYGINDRDALKANEDGSIDILVQKEKPKAEWIPNWLPSGEEAFNLILRIYLTKDEVITGEWKPPVIQEIS